MSASGGARNTAIRTVRWTARILGALMVLLLFVFAAGEGLPHPAQLSAGEKLGFIALGVMVLGVAVAWRTDGLGGLLLLIGYGIFAVWSQKIVAGLFAVFALAGVLHMVCWWLTRRDARIIASGG